MKQLMKTVCAGAALGLLAGCGVASQAEKTEGIDFSQYKTFAFADDGAPANPVVMNNVKTEIATELKKKDGSRQTCAPIFADVCTGGKKEAYRETSPVVSPPVTEYVYGRRGVYGVPGVVRGYRTRTVPYREGDLTITATDAKTKEVVWQGWAESKVQRGPLTTSEATADVKSMLKKLPAHG